MPNTNDLVARYLQAVRFWLPRATRHDILAEIAEDLQSQIDDRAAALGRPLSEAEVSEILKQRGRPMIVASSYLPQSQLIGPALFPVYVFVLKAVALGYFLPWILVWFGFLIFYPRFLVEHSGLHPFSILWTLAWSLFGIITVGFAIIDRTSTRSKLACSWDPRKLPRVREKKGRRKAEAIAGIVFGLLWIVWLFLIPSRPYLILGPPGFFLRFSSLWRPVYPWIIVLAIAGLLRSTLILLRNLPEWAYQVSQLVAICLQALIVAMLLRAGSTWFVASTQPPVEWLPIANLACHFCLGGMAIALVIAFFVHASKAVHAWLRPPGNTVTPMA
ncbi:MAG TPA: hypothetical protein VMA71_03105 [Alloacidobacterium sp.]|nr:hypothetical protein [Alloacidobacterium sp.]